MARGLYVTFCTPVVLRSINYMFNEANLQPSNAAPRLVVVKKFEFFSKVSNSRTAI